VNKEYLISCFFFIFLTTANAEQLYSCVDSHGNKIFTSSPQDGMTCTTGEIDEQSSAPQIASKSKGKSSDNLVEICNNLFSDLEDVSDEIKSLDKRRSELQNKQHDIRRSSIENHWSRPTEMAEMRHVTDEQNKINMKMSSLYQNKSKINDDIREYKCEQLKRDLSRVNQSSSGHTDSSKGKGRTTVIMRNNNTVILRR
jgi:hypothetical protein